MTAFSLAFRGRDHTSSSRPEETTLHPSRTPESLLGLYVDTHEELDAIAARLGRSETAPANPYWQRKARAFEDPDVYQVLLTLRASSP